MNTNDKELWLQEHGRLVNDSGWPDRWFAPGTYIARTDSVGSDAIDDLYEQVKECLYSYCVHHEYTR